MEKRQMGFEDYLSDIDPNFTDVASEIHHRMTGLGCRVKLQEAKSGHVVSYQHPQNGKTVANLVSRKGGPVIRVYGDNCAGYQAYLDTMPEPLEKLVLKAPSCKRLLDPAKCSSRCSMGYTFTIKGDLQKKCRFGSFMFPVSLDTLPWILPLLKREMEARTA